MSSLNTVAVTGRLGSDPEIRYTQNGKCICTAQIAVDGFSAGEKKTNWFTVKLFDKKAETFNEYALKGSMVGISGRLNEETWTDQATNQKRSKVVILANDYALLSSKKDAGTAAEHAEAPAGDEIPF